MKCNLCGGDHFEQLFYKAPFNRVRCTGCNLTTAATDLTREQAKEFYDQHYFKGGMYYDYIKDEPIITRNARARMLEINKICPPGVCLDVGCAAGFFLNVARSFGWETFGVELSSYAAAYAQKELGLFVINGVIEDSSSIIPPQSLDLVTMWDFIEHVSDPMRVLQHANYLLKSGAFLALSTGDIDSVLARLMGMHWRLFTPDHLYYFSQKTITMYLKRTGFELVSLGRQGRFVSLNLMFHQVFKSVKLPLPCLRRLKLPALSLYINLWDVMTVIAKKINGA